MQDTISKDELRSLVADNSRLLVSAYINQRRKQKAEPILVRRGMSILTSEGLEVGRVAAVVVAGEDDKITHLLLGRLPDIPEYRLVSLDLITHIGQDSLKLNLKSEELEDLPLWHTSE